MRGRGVRTYNSGMAKLAIIGGGAAGLACAVEVAERLRALGAQAEVAIYERDERVGRSILASGNGRCNFSNAHVDAALYHNAQFVEQAFSALTPAEVHAFFAREGLMWREEDDGRLYPLANKASSVLDVLRAAAKAAGAVEACGCAVAAIEQPRAAGKPFTLRMADGRFERADAVVIACGGRLAGKLAGDFAPFNELRPVLGPLACASPYPRQIENVRVRAAASLVRKTADGERVIASERGEVMFRKYGVSGIAVFNLSRFAQSGDELRINLLDGMTCEDTLELLRERAARCGAGCACEDVLRGMVLPRVGEVLCKQAGVDAQGALDDDALRALSQVLCAFPLEVEGIADADNCQVRRGGFDVGAIDALTCGVREVPGLYIVGEALDVDAPCGGFNLHWAWTSGLLAARDAARALAQMSRVGA